MIGYKIGNNYFTVNPNERGNSQLQQVSEGDIRARANNKTAEELVQMGDLKVIDPSSFKITTSADNQSLKNLSAKYGKPLSAIDRLGEWGEVLLPDNYDPSMFQNPNAFPKDMELAKYLKETGQTYDPATGYAGQPWSKDTPEMAAAKQQATKQQPGAQQLPAGAKMYQVDGKAYYSPSGVGYDAQLFDPAQYGMDINSLGKGIKNATAYSGGAQGGGGNVPPDISKLGRTYNEQGWINSAGEYENPQLSKGGGYFKYNGQAYDSNGRELTLSEFKQLGLNLALMPEGNPKDKQGGAGGGGGGTTDGRSSYALSLSQDGAVTTGELPQERDARFGTLEDRLAKSDEIISRIMSAYMPTDQENKLQKTLDDLMTSRDKGLLSAEGESIGMSALIGQQALIEKQANAKIASVQRELERLSGNREAQAKMLEKVYDIGRQQLSDALAFYKATAPDKLYLDEKTGTAWFQNPITGEITSKKLAGFTPQPAEVKHSAIYNEWMDYKSTGGKLDFDAYQTMDANRKRSVTSISYNQQQDMALRDNTQKVGAYLTGRAGTDKYVEPSDYKAMKNAWVSDGFSSYDFDKTFSNFVNPKRAVDYGVKYVNELPSERKV